MAGPARPTLDRLAGALAYQQLLLGDARRNRAFARALRARVRKGASVLDLGSGSGVLGGARRAARRPAVVAIEREAVLVPLIEAFAREAGVADRVRVMRAEAGRVRLRREFDVVIGELVGNEGFDEGLLPVFERARDRFLRRGGALVPEWLALVAAPARVPVALGISPPILPARRDRVAHDARAPAACTPPSCERSRPAASSSGSTCARRAPATGCPWRARVSA